MVKKRWTGEITGITHAAATYFAFSFVSPLYSFGTLKKKEFQISRCFPASLDYLFRLKDFRICQSNEKKGTKLVVFEYICGT